MQLLVAMRRFMFAGTTVEENEKFYAKPAHAKVLKTLGRAEDAPDDTSSSPALPPAPTYQRRDMQAVLPGVSVIDDLRGQYRMKFGTDANRRWREARLRKELGL
jgi:hypothetical protein